MSKLIGMLIGMSALVCMISASEVSNHAELEKVLELKLENGGKAKVILQKVPKEDRVAVKIGGVSVAEILSYLDTSCSSQTLEDPRLLELEGKGLNWQYGFTKHYYSKGLDEFFKYYIPKRIDSCKRDFSRIFKEAVEAVGDFGREDKKVLSKLNGIFKPSIKRTKESWEQDGTFHRCVKLIKKLSVAKSIDKPESRQLDENDLAFTKQWYDLLEACKQYTERQCLHCYHPYDPVPPSLLSKPKKVPKDEYYELNMQCLSIREIGLSDKTKAKRIAEQEELSGRVRPREKREKDHQYGSLWYPSMSYNPAPIR